jgi:hypothetical protein
LKSSGVQRLQWTVKEPSGTVFHTPHAANYFRPNEVLRSVPDAEPWQPGDPRNGWTSLGPLPLANATITWIQLEGGDWGYAVIDPGLEGARRFFGAVAPPCPGATFDAREDATALVFCGDRSVAGWSLQGEPLAENPPELREQLLGSTAIRSWDGALLVPV